MYSNLFYLIVFIGSVFAGITCIVSIYMKTKPFVKYLPAVVAGLAAFAFLIKAHFFSKGFGALAYIVFAMSSGTIFLIALIMAVIFELINRRK